MRFSCFSIYLILHLGFNNQLSAQYSTVNWEIIATSPKDKSFFHRPQTSILIKSNEILSLDEINEYYSAKIVGSQSGIHEFKISVSDNKKALVFSPKVDFELGEKVSFSLLRKIDSYLKIHITFTITSNSTLTCLESNHNEVKLQARSNVPSFTITTNNDPWYGNLFFKVSGPPQKPDNILDTSGRLLYSVFRPKKGFDWKVNFNNKITFFDRQIKAWNVMDEFHQIIDTVFCKNGFTADNHDFMALPNGNYILFAYDVQPYAMDTVVTGGDPNATVEGLIIQELDQNQNLLFQWRSWDHFHVLDNIYLDSLGDEFPFIHCNAIDLDTDGHFLLSSRNLDEITKIHRTNGNVLWRWGGSQNDFTFLNDYPFTHQHCIRSLGNNRYILYDNGNFSASFLNGTNLSRGVEYLMDTSLMTVQKIWEFYHPDSLYGPATGSIQRLPNGNTLINWGSLSSMNLGSVVTEVDTNNQIVFQLECVNGQNIYRAHKFDWFFDPSIVGCTENTACNFDQAYLINDSSCYFQLDSAYITFINNTLTAEVNNGVPPYSYLWNTNVTTQQLVNPNPGLYWVIIRDMNNCYSDTIYYDFSSTGVYNYNNTEKLPVKLYNVMGQETHFQYNSLQIYQYGNAIMRKKIVIR